MKCSSLKAPLLSAVRKGVLIVAPLCLASVSLAETKADNYTESAGVVQRIDASGKLRMLSQRVAAASCYVYEGIDIEATTATLAAATREFSSITSALEFGDPNLGIFGLETDIKILATLERLNDLWHPILNTTEKVIAGTATDEDIAQVALQSEQLLEMAKRLVAAETENYLIGTDIVMRDTLAIDVAGRQRMLAQRISKDVCFIASEIKVEHVIDDLAKTSELFGTSLAALRGGMPAAGILPPTNEQVVADLSVAAEDWDIMETKIADVLSGYPISADRLVEVFHLANTLTADMNKVVMDYSAETSGDS